MFAAYSHFLGKLEEAQTLSSAIEHLRPGNAVKTKFGNGWIQVFRPQVRSASMRPITTSFSTELHTKFA